MQMEQKVKRREQEGKRRTGGRGENWKKRGE
jgi:hypothetical protein